MIIFKRTFHVLMLLCMSIFFATCSSSGPDPAQVTKLLADGIWSGACSIGEYTKCWIIFNVNGQEGVVLLSVIKDVKDQRGSYELSTFKEAFYAYRFYHNASEMKLYPFPGADEVQDLNYKLGNDMQLIINSWQPLEYKGTSPHGIIGTWKRGDGELIFRSDGTGHSHYQYTGKNGIEIFDDEFLYVYVDNKLIRFYEDNVETTNVYSIHFKSNNLYFEDDKIGYARIK